MYYKGISQNVKPISAMLMRAMGAMLVLRQTKLFNDTRTEKQKLLLLGEGNLHGVTGCNFESLQGFASSSRLNLVLKFNEGDIVSTWH